MTNSKRYAPATDTARFHELYFQIGGYRGSLPTGTVRRWEWYFERLDHDEITTKTVDRLRDAWELAAANDDDQPAYSKCVVTTRDELCAENPGEFVELLQNLIIRSGVSVDEIARRAPNVGQGKLNRSQIYSVLKRRVPPLRGEQVRSWGLACGLDPELVGHLLALWAELKMTKYRGQRCARLSSSANEVGTTVGGS